MADDYYAEPTLADVLQRNALDPRPSQWSWEAQKPLLRDFLLKALTLAPMGLMRAPMAPSRWAAPAADIAYDFPRSPLGKGLTDEPLRNPFPGHARPVLDPEGPAHNRAMVWPSEIAERAVQRSLPARARPDLWAAPALSAPAIARLLDEDER